MGPERGAPAVSKTAAVAIATRFTADVLSWDEDAPEVRAAALGADTDDPHNGRNTGAAGWDGRGRQRVDLVLPPEQVLRLATGELLVSLTARLVTYLRTAAIWSDPSVTGSGCPRQRGPARCRRARRGTISRHARLGRHAGILGHHLGHRPPDRRRTPGR